MRANPERERRGLNPLPLRERVANEVSRVRGGGLFHRERSPLTPDPSPARGEGRKTPAVALGVRPDRAAHFLRCFSMQARVFGCAHGESLGFTPNGVKLLPGY